MNNPPINDLDHIYLATKEHTESNKEICDLLRRMMSHLEIITQGHQEIIELLSKKEAE